MNTKTLLLLGILGYLYFKKQPFPEALANCPGSPGCPGYPTSTTVPQCPQGTVLYTNFDPITEVFTYSCDSPYQLNVGVLF